MRGNSRNVFDVVVVVISRGLLWTLNCPCRPLINYYQKYSRQLLPSIVETGFWLPLLTLIKASFCIRNQVLTMLEVVVLPRHEREFRTSSIDKQIWEMYFNSSIISRSPRYIPAPHSFLRFNIKNEQNVYSRDMGMMRYHPRPSLCAATREREGGRAETTS